MLVATPGQTTAYSTLHNSSNASGGSGVGSTNTNATVTNKKTNTTSLNSTTAIVTSGTPKLQNNNHTVSSTGINRNSLNSNTHATTYNNYQQNFSKSDNNVCSSKHSNNNSIISNKTAAATSSREKLTSATTITHSLKNENSTTINSNTTSSSSSSKQSFIQTLKDSVQKALISTTGNKSIINNKTNNNSNNNYNKATTTSTQNVTSSSSTTNSSTHNTNKVSTTTTSSTTSSNSTSAAATQSSSSSLPSVRSKYFSCSLSKLHTVAPTIIHRYPEERQNASSTDSLQKEMCHFKPIRIAPTTPWKSGSKSRGNSLRFPKANIATKATEFILKSNCDVNNKKRKQQQIRTQVNKIGEDDDRNEQENTEFYGIYKPKPSLTCLSTSFNTPNHQSAFVCLVAQMKNLVNVQSTKLVNAAKSSRTGNLSSHMEAGKTKTTRSMRTIRAATSTTISSTTSMDKSVKELFVRQKPKPAKKLVQTKRTAAVKEIPIARSTRLASNAVKKKTFSTTSTTIKNKSKENIKRTNAKTKEISKLSKVAIMKPKSRRNIGRAKSKMINIVTLAKSSTKAKEKLLQSERETVGADVSIEPRKTRKRKLTVEMDTEAIATSSSPLLPAQTSSVKSLLKGRKSTKVSNVKQQIVAKPKQIAETIPLKKIRKSSTRSTTCFSPPLTRSRLKNLEAQGETIPTATTNTKKRRI